MNIYSELFKEFLGLLFGLGMFIPGLIITRKRMKLLRASKKVRGTVLRLVQDEDEAYTSLYYPVVEFEIADKGPIVKQYHIGRQFTAYSPGASIVVLYNKSNPQKFVIDTARDEYTGIALITAGIVTIVISIALFIFYLMIWTW